MVEVMVHCAPGNHNFVVKFPDPVDWAAVTAAVKATEAHCEEHKPQPWHVDWE